MDIALYKRHALAVSPVLDRVSIINNWSNDDILDDKGMYIGNNSSMVKSVNIVERTLTPERQIIIVNNYHHKPIDFSLNGTQMVANAKNLMKPRSTVIDKLIQMTPASSPIPPATSSSSSSSSSLSSVGAIPTTTLSPSSSVHNHLLHRTHLSKHPPKKIDQRQRF